jgi:hypothetical protein
MVPNTIAPLHRLSHNYWIRLRLTPKTEKRGMYAISLKRTQNQRSKERLRSIVERQGYRTRYSPGQAIILRTL